MSLRGSRISRSRIAICRSRWAIASSSRPFFYNASASQARPSAARPCDCRVVGVRGGQRFDGVQALREATRWPRDSDAVRTASAPRLLSAYTHLESAISVCLGRSRPSASARLLYSRIAFCGLGLAPRLPVDLADPEHILGMIEQALRVVRVCGGSFLRCRPSLRDSGPRRRHSRRACWRSRPSRSAPGSVGPARRRSARVLSCFSK